MQNNETLPQSCEQLPRMARVNNETDGLKSANSRQALGYSLNSRTAPLPSQSIARPLPVLPVAPVEGLIESHRKLSSASIPPAQNQTPSVAFVSSEQQYSQPTNERNLYRNNGRSVLGSRNSEELRYNMHMRIPEESNDYYGESQQFREYPRDRYSHEEMAGHVTYEHCQQPNAYFSGNGMQGEAGLHQQPYQVYQQPNLDRSSSASRTPFVMQYKDQASQQTLVPIHMSNVDSKVSRKRFCCGNFRTRKGCITTSLFVTILVLLSLAVIGFFIFPRIVIQNAKLGSAVVPVLAINLTYVSAELGFDVKTDVVSQSYITYKLDDIHIVSLSIVHPTSANQLVVNPGTLTVSGQISGPVFPPMATTQLTMVIINVTFSLLPHL